MLVLAIGLSKWAMFARTVRGSTLVELKKDYVDAARLIERASAAIALMHVLPNTLGPVLVLATRELRAGHRHRSHAELLGVGLPPSTPSLGTLIHVGNEYSVSGQWWMAILPGIALIMLVVSVNIVGDWLRDVFNPKLADDVAGRPSDGGNPGTRGHAAPGRRRVVRDRAGRGAGPGRDSGAGKSMTGSA